jgi:hypothetical protein
MFHGEQTHISEKYGKGEKYYLPEMGQIFFLELTSL